jgi:integrase
MPKPEPLDVPRIKSIQPPAKGQEEHADGACQGLRLRVSQGGTFTWVLGCRDVAGRPRRFVMGNYPALGLSDARKKAKAMREKVRQGADPIREKREKQAATAAAKVAEAIAAKVEQATLTALLEAYAKDVGARRRSWPEARRRIENVFGAHLCKPTAKLTLAELQLTVDAHPSRSSAGAGVRFIRPVLKWGAKRDLVTWGIAERLSPPDGALGVRERKLTRAEMAAILRVLDDAGGYGRAMRWLFWTGCRLNEACGARWRDINIDTGVWTVPRTQTKQGREHVVPPPGPALALLDTLLPLDEAGKVVAPDPEALIFTGAEGGVLANWDRATKAIQKASGTTAWHRHDIRRTVASLMGDLGVAPHVVEVCLGHAIRTSADGSSLSRVAGIYNRSRYSQEHADALLRLADELARIETADAQA